jgi:hypothetical protein
MTPTWDVVTDMTVVCHESHNRILGHSVYKARVYFQGRPTSIDCLHNHKTPEATVKCQTRMFAEMTAILDTAKAIENGEEPGLFDIHYIGPDAYGDRIDQYIRFYWKDTEGEE